MATGTATGGGGKKLEVSSDAPATTATTTTSVNVPVPAVLNVKPSHVRGKIETSRAVSICVKELGWTEVVDTVNGKATAKHWTIGWVDAIGDGAGALGAGANSGGKSRGGAGVAMGGVSGSSSGGDFFRTLKPFQRLNHFPGIEHLCRKKQLARHLNAMRTITLPAAGGEGGVTISDEFRFFPHTWILPQDEPSLLAAINTNARLSTTTSTNKREPPHTFIVKPDGSCQGKGIFLARTLSDLKSGGAVATAGLSAPSAASGDTKTAPAAVQPPLEAVAQLYVPNVSCRSHLLPPPLPRPPFLCLCF